MSVLEVIACGCGLIVVARDELNEDGLCCDCAATEVGEICVCSGCDETRARLADLEAHP